MKYLIPTTLASLAVLSVAHAEPTLYPSNLGVLSSIKNDTDSNILADEVDAKTVWVMPPNTASAVVQGLNSKTANMGFCAEMGDIKNDSRDLTRQIKELSDKKRAHEDELIALKAKADAANEAAEAYATEKNLETIRQLDDQIKAEADHLNDLYDRDEKCSNDCDAIQAEIKSTQEDKARLEKQRADLIKQHTADWREYDKRAKAAAAAMKTYQDSNKVYQELANDIRDARESLLKEYASFTTMGGAKASFVYVSHWDDNLKALRAANPGYNFAKVATKNAILAPEIAGVDNIDPTGAIMSINIAKGLKDGVVNLPSYPESLSTNVALSLLGACPMEHPEYFDVKDNDASKMRYGMIISYDYDSIFSVKASATYNMYKMYQKIVSSGSSGGLFSSRSWSSVEEKNFFRDSFSVKWDDRENSLSQEQKDQRETEMRHNVMLRLATLALPQTPAAAQIINAAAPPTRGSIVLADQLATACGVNVYCQGAGIVLRVLDAIFGSSSSSSSYTNIQDVNITDSYENVGKITKPWVTSYLDK